MIQILAASSPGEIRAAAVERGRLLDYAISRPGVPDSVGDRMRGRVIAQVQALAGSFVALPGGAEGFLPDSQAPPGLTAGAAVTVVVVRAPQGGKGPRLSAKTPQAGAGPPALIKRGPTAIEQLAAQYPDASVTVDDPAAAAGLPSGAAIDPAPWDDALASEIEALSRPIVDLPGGARAGIYPTPALVAIDMDIASATADRRAKAPLQRDMNRAALPGLARAIRLRNLSGAIVIDLAGMSLKARARLAPDFAAALASDPLRPRFLGFSALGLAEVLRSRVHAPLHELTGSAHGAALAALGDVARQSAAAPASQIALNAAPDVAGAIENDPIARADLARRTGRPLMLRLNPALPPGAWTTEPIERVRLP